jgi:hypothetical protein
MMGWRVSTLVDSQETGRYASLALDAAGFPHISFRDPSYGGLMYAFADGAGWHVGPISDDEWVGDRASLSFDDEGHPHVGYVGYAGTVELRHAYHDATGWHTEIIEEEPRYHDLHPSLALDSGGSPCIACLDIPASYADAAGPRLFYARRGASGWQNWQIDEGGRVGEYLSLALATMTRPRSATLTRRTLT